MLSALVDVAQAFQYKEKNMKSKEQNIIDSAVNQDYKYGFTTDIEQEKLPPGLNEDVIKFISAKKDEPEWLLKYRLKAFKHWETLSEPKWALVNYPEIDFQSIELLCCA